jgi:two-component system response regulator MprA
VTPPEPPSAPRRKVVLVDRDAAVRAALAFSLELDGYEVETLESGAALGGAALPATGACLVVDAGPGDLAGLEALETLRRRGVDLPAILVTNDLREAVFARARNCGASVLEKPLMGDTLTTRISEVLHRPGAPAGGP